MLANKRVRRVTACLLLLCMLVCLVPGQASAETETKAAAGRTVSLVRRSAYFSSVAIGCLENGTYVTVLSESKQFYRIDCYDMTGYIAKSQVKQDENGEYYVSCVSGASETTTLPTRTPEEAVALRGQIRTEALKYQGVPYVWGGTTPRGFDCSGFTQYVFGRVGAPISRNCLYQLSCGVIVAREDLQCGDLIFFENTGDGGFASHVGIYIGNGQLIHAGSKGITVVYLSDSYFDYHYMCARRVVISDASYMTGETVIPAVGITQNINGSYWRESSQTEEESGNSFFAAGGRRHYGISGRQVSFHHWALPVRYCGSNFSLPLY